MSGLACRILLAGWLGLPLSAQGAARVVVDAGGHSRVGTPVSLRVPEPGPWELVDARGTARPLQVDADGVGWFVAGRMDAGTRETLVVRRPAGGAVAAGRVEALLNGGRVRVAVGGSAVFEYQMGPTELPPGRPDLSPIFRRGGYLHPVWTPSGRQVTDDYPASHRHHHGVWFAWTRVEFEGRKTDFWNMGEGKGTVEFVALDGTWSGPVHGGFRSRHRQVDLTSGGARTAMHEGWVARVFDVGTGVRARVVDLEVTDTCAGEAPVRLPRYRYGGLGIRGHGLWNDAARMGFLNSEGTRDRGRGDEAGTVGRWALMHGALEGGAAGGIAVLGHPSNAMFPQPQRIHPTEPFLCMAPQQAGDLELRPGVPLVSRYRLVTFDGEPDGAWVERLWRDYAEPPVARWESGR